MSTLDKVRAVIRAEVERAQPIEDARSPLELIVESAVRYSETDGRLTITVLDESGQPSDSRTIADVIADFRAQHPTLFRSEPAPAPAAGGKAAAAEARGNPPAASGPAPAAASAAATPQTPAPRDWLIVGGKPEAAAAAQPASLAGKPGAQAAAQPAAISLKPGATAASSPSPMAGRLDGGLNAARAELARVADRLRPGLSLGSQALAARLGRMGQALRASVSMARSTLDDFGDKPAPMATAGPAVAMGAGPRAPRVEAASARQTRQALIATGTTPWFRRRQVIAAGIGTLALVLGGAFLYSLLPFEDRAAPPSATVASAPPLASTPPVSTPPARRPMTPPEPGNTGSVPPNPPPAARPPAPAPLPEGALRGVPEVIDTATLSVGGKVVPLFGVQWTRGAGEPSDLAGYLRNREVTCRPAEGSAKAFRCEVEGQDLSKVVLFNGGGRATSEATPDLLAAEAHARSSKTGLWARANP